MEFIKPDIDINFSGKRNIGFAISAILIVISIASVFIHGGLRMGVDFEGGSLIQMVFKGEATVASDIEKALEPMKLADGKPKYDGLSIQQVGTVQENEFLIHVKNTTEETSNLAEEMKADLEGTYGSGMIDIRSSDMVGPRVGKTLRRQGRNAIVWAIVCIFLYITLRFDFKFAIGAIVALIHDVIITVGALSLMNKEFDLTIVAALLTVVGYSINDTVVVYDRLRENLRKSRKKSFDAVVNRSINETLSRTVLTSLTTLIVLVCIFLFAGGSILNFAFTMIVGVVIGTYSSILVASPIVVVWEKLTAEKSK